MRRRRRLDAGLTLNPFAGEELAQVSGVVSGDPSGARTVKVPEEAMLHGCSAANGLRFMITNTPVLRE